MKISSDYVKVDGRTYRINVKSLRRSFTVLDKYFNRTEDGNAHREPLGTYYNYTIKFGWNKDYPDDYDALYETLSAPEEKHIISVPYGKSGSLTYEAYVSKGSDDLLSMHENNLWDNFSVDFVAKKPKRR